MTAQGIIIALGVLGGLAAVAFEVWLWKKRPPSRWALSYAAWTATIMAFLAGVDWDKSAGRALAIAILIGPLVYPLIAGLVWVRFFDLEGYVLRRRQAGLDRLTPRATDFGGVAMPPPSHVANAAPQTNIAALERPLTVAPTRWSLGRVYRPPWRGPEEIAAAALGSLLVAAALVGAYAWTIVGSVNADRQAYAMDRQAVGETLEMNGYAAARVQPYGSLPECSGYVYRWRAVGAAGRACVDYDGYVSVWVEQRWAAERPTAPGSEVATDADAHDR